MCGSNWHIKKNCPFYLLCCVSMKYYMKSNQSVVQKHILVMLNEWHRGPIESSDNHVYSGISCDYQTNVHPYPASFACSLSLFPLHPSPSSSFSHRNKQYQSHDGWSGFYLAERCWTNSSTVKQSALLMRTASCCQSYIMLKAGDRDGRHSPCFKLEN